MNPSPPAGNRRRLREPLQAQLGAPHGTSGRVLLHALNLLNGRLNRATVDALALTPGERVLDVGFGGGVGIRRALQAKATVIAIDPSPTAVNAARQRFGDTVEIRLAGAADPGEKADSCDAAYAVNSVYFWPDLTGGLHALHEILRPGGRLALGIEATELARLPKTHSPLPRTASELAGVVSDAGFSELQLYHHRAGRAVILARTRAC